MTDKNAMTALLILTGLLLAPLATAQTAAQTETPSVEPGNDKPAGKKTNTGSQEVEYDDDNYRRFMELKDQPTQNSSLPTTAFRPGTQKLDKLPEASQKHLRNQLREIILEDGEWTPGDENKEYPYVPSEAAEQSPTLQQQEVEAWGELVGKYNEREAQIYNNASRSTSTASDKAGAPDASQTQANAQRSGNKSAGESAASGNSGSDATGTGDEKKQAGQGQQSAQASNQGSYSPASSANPNDPNAKSTAGVSQNAMEFLMKNGSVGTQDGETDSASPESTEGISQNAMEFLTKSSQQNTGAARRMSESTDNSGELVVISPGTLSIEDLQNAQGISISTGTGSTGATPIEVEDTDAQGLRKDGDG